ncbi:hypothetical protein [Rhizobium laguerreae]|uniref:hypothetical protein n=1 Tax=Rhizobium laguerreae TaxID=1076926 RepID=UPI001C914C0F|nr:hypothetical protein [Rhizobium laguerreae]MBY3363757.1 hypothetical protein [Rhizobium laguerreae]
MPNGTTKKVEHGFTMRRRNLAVVSSSVNQEARTVEMIAATETPATQWVPDPTQTGSFSQRHYVEADEVLGMDGIDFSRARGMPFGDSHNLYETVDNVLGTVIDMTVDGARLLATAKFRRSKAGLLEDIEDGHLQQVSIGYCVHEYEVVERTDGIDRLMVRATRWTPREISLVAVGADPNAVMRSQDQQLFPEPVFKRSAANTRSKEKTMDEEQIVTLVTAAEDALAALSDVTDDGVSDETKARLAKLRARAEGDDDPDKKETDTADADVSEADKKVEEETRSLAKRKGKDVEEFAEGIRGLKRGKAFRDAVGDYVAARAIAKIAAIPAVTPVIPTTPMGQRSVDLAKELDHVTLFERRKRGYVAGK